ncbi:hypothetical protein V8D89_010284 [Ganoderma adspersum]
MFAVKFSCLTALALAPWAQALLLQIPVDWQSSSPANVSWTNVATDPPFTLQLANTDEFHDTFSIANNVNPTADFVSLTLPVIPQGTYTLRAINVTNAGQIFDETPSFTIQGPPESSSQTSGASTSGSVSASASGSTTLTVSATTKTGASGTAAGSSTGFGVTVSNSGSAASNTGAAAASSGSGSSSAATPSSFNNGAASLPHFAPWAAAALGVIAGAAAVL